MYISPLRLVEACEDSGEFFADCIHKCLDGAGTDDLCLIRIIVSRSEARKLLCRRSQYIFFLPD